MIEIRILYARRAHEAYLLTLCVPEQSTVADAITQSEILKMCPELSLDSNKVGIFGQLCTLNTVLREKDRIEIYRPLVADPKLIRRKKSHKARIPPISSESS